MNWRTGFLALSLLASILASVVVMEMESLRPVAGVDRTMPISHPRKAPPRPAVEDQEDHTDGWLATALARPLFNHDRKPVLPEAKPGAITTQEPLPRLTGVIVGPFGRTAIFAGAEGAKTIAIGEGKPLGPYTVQTIRPGGVTVSGPKGEQFIAPRDDAATRSALAAEIPHLPAPQPVVQQQPVVQAPAGSNLSPAAGQPGAPFNLQLRQNLQNLRAGPAFQRQAPVAPGIPPIREGTN